MVDIATLQARRDIAQEQTRKRRRDRYALARSLGIDSYTAQLIAGWSEQAIRDLAAQQQADQLKQDS